MLGHEVICLARHDMVVVEKRQLAIPACTSAKNSSGGISSAAGRLHSMRLPRHTANPNRPVCCAKTHEKCAASTVAGSTSMTKSRSRRLTLSFEVSTQAAEITRIKLEMCSCVRRLRRSHRSLCHGTPASAWLDRRKRSVIDRRIRLAFLASTHNKTPRRSIKEKGRASSAPAWRPIARHQSRSQSRCHDTPRL
jgi:hypothetical protein